MQNGTLISDMHKAFYVIYQVTFLLQCVINKYYTYRTENIYSVTTISNV